MSLEIGGRADKLANEYERLWVVNLALDVLHGDAAWIYWEPAGDQGQGVELRLGLLNGQIEVHQCKKENGTTGKWPPSSLEKVLQAAKVQLGRPDVNRFVFVSRDRAPELADLAERSHHCSNDPSVFIETSLSSEPHRKAFSQLCAIWELDRSNQREAAEVLRLLQCLQVRVWDDSDPGQLERFATRLAKGRGRDVIASLGNFLICHLGNVVYADDLRRHLKDSGYPPLDLRPGDVAAAIERLRDEFEKSVGTALIGDNLIPRPETQQLLSTLGNPDGPRIMLLHGSSGAGKSSVLLELVRSLSAGTVVLPVRLDIHRPEKDLDHFSADLGLPAAPGDSLAAFASGRPAVLVVDQLDAIRWTGFHAGKAWLICKEMIERALDFPNLRVVAACRTFDLDEDQQISRWEKSARECPTYRLERFEAKDLEENVVRNVVESRGTVYDSMTPRQRRLLANPQCLYVWCSLRSGEMPPRAFETQTDLLAEYWAFIRSRLTGTTGVASTDLDALVEDLVDYLDRHGRLDAPRSLVLRHKQALDALRSFGVLQQLGNSIRFTHQSYVDYLVAERVLRAATQEAETPVEWLRKHDQSLLRRQQLRELLLLLRDREPEFYASTLQGILKDPGVRFHLKHLVLNHLRTIPVPNKDERALVVEYLAKPEWRTHVLEETVARNPGWFDVLAEEGIVESWLASPEEEPRTQAGWLCQIFARERPDEVERYLAKAWNSGEESLRRTVDLALPFDPEEQTDRMFRWRLERVRTRAHNVDFFEIQRLAKRDGLRSVQLLEACIQHALAVCEAGSPEARNRREEVDFQGKQFDPLEAACRENATEAWERLAPLLGKALALMRKLDDEGDAGRVDHDHLERRESVRAILPVFDRLLPVAGASIAQADWQNAINLIEALGVHDGDATRRVIARTLLGGPPESADYAINWLCSAPERFELRESRQRPADDPARALVQKFSPHCSEACFAQLEESVIGYHTPWEMESVRHQLELLRERNYLIFPNRYGKPQSILLSAMPTERLSKDARQRREIWQRKFGAVEEYRADISSSGGWVGSPVHGKTKLVSDTVWLRIINKDWSDRSRNRRQAGPDRLIEASVSTFARALQEAAHKQPSRFTKLAVSIPRTADPTYFAALITGIAETNPPSDAVVGEWAPACVGEIEKVFEHIAPFANAEVAKAICWLVRGRPQEGWSARTREMIREVAQSIAEPMPVMSAAGTDAAHEDLEITSLNCVCGAVAQAIAALTYADTGLVEEFIPTIRAMAKDDRAAVRVAAMDAIAPMYNYNRDLSADLFVEACRHHDDRILGSRATGYLLRYLRDPYADQIRPILERMTKSSIAAAAESGAFWVTVQRYTLGREADLAEPCITGTVRQRKGSVDAMVALCETDDWRTAVQENLSRFFDDTDDEVLSSATEVFRSEKVLAAPSVGPVLAQAFVSSSGFERRPRLLDWLEHWEGSLLPYAESILLSVERLSGDLAGNTRNASRPYGMIDRDTVTVLLRLYGEVEDLGSRELRSKCLDAWDGLLKSRVGFAKDQLDKLDMQ